MECCKYEKDGTPKKAFAGKSVERTLHSRDVMRDHNSAYVQLSAKIAKLEKSNRKLKHASKKRKHNHKNDNNTANQKHL
jgi:hypothetical protein